MKKILFRKKRFLQLPLVCILLLMSMNAHPQRMVRTGMRWDFRIDDVDYNRNFRYSYEIGEKVCLKCVEAYEVIEIYYDSKGHQTNYVKGYVREEDNKIWLYDETDGGSWKLLYDFDIKPGEERIITEGSRTKKDFRVVCLAIMNHEQLSYPIYVLDVTKTGPYDPWSTYHQQTIWIKGIGSMYGFLKNIPPIGYAGFNPSFLGRVYNPNRELIFDADMMNPIIEEIESTIGLNPNSLKKF